MSRRRTPRLRCAYGDCDQPATHRVRYLPLPALPADPPLSGPAPAISGYTVRACEWDAVEARSCSYPAARVYRFRRLK